jgi:hypothetical protein
LQYEDDDVEEYADAVSPSAFDPSDLPDIVTMKVGVGLRI